MKLIELTKVCTVCRKRERRCWALKNLRLLLAKDNIKKKDKLKKPFQPSLLL